MVTLFVLVCFVSHRDSRKHHYPRAVLDFLQRGFCSSVFPSSSCCVPNRILTEDFLLLVLCIVGERCQVSMVPLFTLIDLLEKAYLGGPEVKLVWYSVRMTSVLLEARYIYHMWSHIQVGIGEGVTARDVLLYEIVQQLSVRNLRRSEIEFFVGDHQDTDQVVQQVPHPLSPLFALITIILMDPQTICSVDVGRTEI